MKTGDIYNHALVNPMARFISVDRSLFPEFVAYFNEVGKLVTADGEKESLVYAPYSMEWELVPKEVTWQEAISAWLDGKKVHYVINNNKVYLVDSFYLRVDGARPISKDELSKCKWFIE